MSKVSLGGSPTGTATFDIVAPATNTNRTITLPDASGPIPVMQLLTAKSATGTAVDFSDIPSWVKKITVMFNGVSTNGTSLVQVQLGAGTVQTTGYFGAAQLGTSTQTSTSGVPLFGNSASDARTGLIVFSNQTASTWVGSGAASSNDANAATIAGRVALSDTLTQVRITTVNGTDTFDAGTINLLLEGY